MAHVWVIEFWRGGEWWPIWKNVRGTRSEARYVLGLYRPTNFPMRIRKYVRAGECR